MPGPPSPRRATASKYRVLKLRLILPVRDEKTSALAVVSAATAFSARSRSTRSGGSQSEGVRRHAQLET